MSYSIAKAKHDSTSGNGGDGAVLQALMCSAHGCPNLWSTSDGNLCRWHSAAEPNRWPEITQQQQWDETERSRMRGEPEPYVEPLTRADKAAVIARMREVLANFGRPKEPNAWAIRLRDRERTGERLGEHRRAAWREALKVERAGEGAA